MPEDLTPSSEPEAATSPRFPIVGIGASSGGLSALLGLFDEGVAEHLPAEILDPAVHFFEGLVDRDGANGNG